jgi:hypothetical protein
MVGPDRARAIVAARPLESWQDAARIPRFSLGTIDYLKRGGATLGSKG